MRTTERHARNDRVVQLRVRGLTIKMIAKEIGVSERHCARILNERKQTDRSSASRPTESTSASNATATELLDRLQRTVGDLGVMARERLGPPSVGRLLRVGIMVNMAERNIAELRSRSEQLAPVDPRAEKGSPLSEADMS